WIRSRPPGGSRAGPWQASRRPEGGASDTARGAGPPGSPGSAGHGSAPAGDPLPGPGPQRSPGGALTVGGSSWSLSHLPPELRKSSREDITRSGVFEAGEDHRGKKSAGFDNPARI